MPIGWVFRMPPGGDQSCNVRTRGKMQLVQNVPDMGIRRSLRDLQLRCDLAVREPVCHQQSNLTLTWGKCHLGLTCRLFFRLAGRHCCLSSGRKRFGDGQVQGEPASLGPRRREGHLAQRCGTRIVPLVASYLTVEMSRRPLTRAGPACKMRYQN